VAGGLATALGPALIERGGTWFSAPMTVGDRRVAHTARIQRIGHLAVQFVDIDPVTYGHYYDGVSNRLLWPLLHGMLDMSADPSLRDVLINGWPQYRSANLAFARAVGASAPEGALVLVQDYHLMLVGCYLSLFRPDLRIAHFLHTPFCEPSELEALPTAVSRELLMAMGSFRSCGFHSTRWESAFQRCCAQFLGTAPSTFVDPLGVHPGDLQDVLDSPSCAAARDQLDALVGDRALIVRVDRLDPTKNLVRGFQAFDHLLRTRPSWRGRVVFLAHAVPSREALPNVQRYRAEVETVVEQINRRWGDPHWTPIVLEISGNRARSFAALTSYDVLMVNSVRDGMNLVALEGALTNVRNGVIILSHEVGAWERLSGSVLSVDPFDIEATAGVLYEALTLALSERVDISLAARRAASCLSAEDWLKVLVTAALEPDVVEV
jgi:trehalose 6-phosphate synthase